MEVLLPGGTLFALLLYFYRRSQQNPGRNVDVGSGFSIARIIRSIREEVVFLVQPYDDLGWPWNGIRDGLEVLAIVPAR